MLRLSLKILGSGAEGGARSLRGKGELGGLWECGGRLVLKGRSLGGGGELGRWNLCFFSCLGLVLWAFCEDSRVFVQNLDGRFFQSCLLCQSKLLFMFFFLFISWGC